MEKCLKLRRSREIDEVLHLLVKRRDISFLAPDTLLMSTNIEAVFSTKPSPPVLLSQPTVPSGKASQSSLVIRNDVSTWFKSIKRTVPTKEFSDSVIVVVPGSREIKMGRALDALPVIHPAVLACRGGVTENLQFEQELSEKEYTTMLDNRSKQTKRRSPPGVYAAMQSYNEQQSASKPERIPQHNDPHSIDYVKGDEGVIVGADALRLSNAQDYQLIYPMQAGRLVNASLMAELIVRLLSSEFGVKDKQAFLVFVVPEGWNRKEIISISDALMKMHGFVSVAFIQEAVACCYGAGISNAIVVDCGPTKTSISCVEEGVCWPETRLALPYGGESLARMFYDCLRLNGVSSLPIEVCWRSFVDELTLNTLTLQEEDLGPAPSVLQLAVRQPHVDCLKFSFKAWEERILVPLCIFESGLDTLIRYKEDRSYCVPFDDFYAAEDKTLTQEPLTEETSAVKKNLSCKACRKQFKERSEVIDHIYSQHTSLEICPWCKTRRPDEGLEFWPCHLANHMIPEPTLPSIIEKHSEEPVALALDEAIVESLRRLPEFSPVADKNTRIARLGGSVLLVGGWSSLHGLAGLLQYRLRAMFPLTDLLTGENIDTSKQWTVLGSKDLDPRMLSWKGGSVFARLLLNSSEENGSSWMQDVWIGREEWINLEERILKERLAFNASSYN